MFDENGGSLQRLVTGGQLAAPWGVALAPAGFGQFGGDLLVGNFSFVASEINAFDPLTGAFQGTIPIDVGAGNTPGGLWALEFGSGAGNGGDANTLYFNDGINGEANGLFAALEVPGQTITKGNGDFTLDIGSNSTVTLGNGDDTITGGHNNKLTIGKGDQSITLSGATIQSRSVAVTARSRWAAVAIRSISAKATIPCMAAAVIRSTSPVER